MSDVCILYSKYIYVHRYIVQCLSNLYYYIVRRVRCAFAFASKQKAQRKQRKPQTIRTEQENLVNFDAARHIQSLSIFCNVRVPSQILYILVYSRGLSIFDTRETLFSRKTVEGLKKNAARISVNFARS